MLVVTMRDDGDKRLVIGLLALGLSFVGWIAGLVAFLLLTGHGDRSYSDTEAVVMFSFAVGVVMLLTNVAGVVLSIVAIRRPKRSRAGTVVAVTGIVLSAWGVPGSLALLALVFFVALFAYGVIMT